MILERLIEALEKMPADAVVKHGFGRPFSWRGSYSELSFEPEENAVIGDMLAHARSALGQTFTGYKGGEFKMHGYTDCYIDPYGECPGNGISEQLVAYWAKEAEEA